MGGDAASSSPETGAGGGGAGGIGKGESERVGGGGGATTSGSDAPEPDQIVFLLSFIVGAKIIEAEFVDCDTFVTVRVRVWIFACGICAVSSCTATLEFTVGPSTL